MSSIQKQTLQQVGKMGKVITVANLAGSDAVDCAIELISQFPKGTKNIIVEMPCIGSPRLAHRKFSKELMMVKKENTIDQFFLDYDREEPKDVKQYIIEYNKVDYMLLYPKSFSDNPVTNRLNSNRSLIEGPGYLKQHLQHEYDHIVILVQGMLTHPTTFFSIRCADNVVLYSDRKTDQIGNEMSHDRLYEFFGVAKERLFLFSSDKHAASMDHKVYTRYNEMLSKMQQVASIPLNVEEGATTKWVEGEAIGRINPIDYLNYQYTPSLLRDSTKEEEKRLDALEDFVRGELRSRYLSDFFEMSRNAEARQRVRYYIADIVKERTDFEIDFMSTQELIERMQQVITMFGPLQPTLDDITISSIEVNNIDQVIVEQNGKDVWREDIVFRDQDEIYQIINRMLAPYGKTLSSSEPSIDAYYEGMRISVIADSNSRAGISSYSPLISIRKFPPSVYSRQTCIQNGNMSIAMDEFLAFVIPCKATTVVAGSTNSGKTSKVQMLPMYVSPLTRIISIEDSKEMMLADKEEYKDYKNLPSLTVKEMEKSEKSITISKLVKASLRLRPTIICIGEIRDEDAAIEAIKAANTGHSLWTTVHANGCREAAFRLLSLHKNKSDSIQIGDAVDFIIFQEKIEETGQRVVTEIAELISFRSEADIEMNTIFKYDQRTKQHVFVNKIKSPGMVSRIYGTSRITDEQMDKWCDAAVLESIRPQKVL